MIEPLDTSMTDEPICPHCGETVSDAWEIRFPSDGSTVIDCGSCENKFRCKKNEWVTYTTEKVGDGPKI